MQIIDLFSGIGGFSYAGHQLGWRTVQMVELNPFCQRVLKYHFPEAAIHSDIKTFNIEQLRKSNWNPAEPSVICGGFPCQPYSSAGKRKGKDDERHLWPEMLRVIREIQPRWVVGENVLGVVNWNGGLVFDEVQADLEAAGYEVWAYVLPACGVNAPHQRFRVWFVAHASTKGLQRFGGYTQDGDSEREKPPTNFNEGTGFPTDNATNPDNARFQKERAKQQATRTQQHRELGGITTDTYLGGGQEYELQTGGHLSETGINTSRDDANSDNKRLQGGKKIRNAHGNWQETEQQPSGVFFTGWQNFPTQSPLCGGDDGLPSGLAGITFPKWRNESIKAYGNSIVPQVAFQIFKTIEEYEYNIHLYS